MADYLEDSVNGTISAFDGLLYRLLDTIDDLTSRIEKLEKDNEIHFESNLDLDNRIGDLELEVSE